MSVLPEFCQDLAEKLGNIGKLEYSVARMHALDYILQRYQLCHDEQMQQKVIVYYLFFFFSNSPPPIPPKRYRRPKAPPSPHDKSPEKPKKSKSDFKQGELFCPVASKYIMMFSFLGKRILDIIGKLLN